MTSAEVTIRKAEARDWPFIRELCCRTGNAGAPIDSARWPFFGEFWVGPYEKLEPEWTYVAELEGRRVGYLTGSPSTRHHNLRRKFLFSFPLFLKTIAGAYPKNGDTRRFLRRFLHLQRGPEDRFPRSEIRKLHSEYPAHLHMNVESDLRKAGVGRKLIERFEMDLRDLAYFKGERISGIHLFCGEGPLKFYGRTGFQELSKIEFVSGVWVYALGKALA